MSRVPSALSQACGSWYGTATRDEPKRAEREKKRKRLAGRQGYFKWGPIELVLDEADPRHLERVRQIVASVVADGGVDLYVYGSWAKGGVTPSSDIDIALDAGVPMSRVVLARIRDALEESTVPYPVEIVDLQTTDLRFREVVRKEGLRWRI